MARNISNNVEDMKNVFEDIFSIECDDALRYDLNTLEVKSILLYHHFGENDGFPGTDPVQGKGYFREAL